MQRSTPDRVLVFAEDPGAANFVAELPGALAPRGWEPRLATSGTAGEYLRRQGVAAEEYRKDASPEALLRSFAPRLLLAGTSEDPDALGLRLIEQAREMGIPSVGCVDAPANAPHRFRGRRTDPLAYAPDWILVPDPWTLEEYVRLGFPADRVVVSGHPRYDFVRSVGSKLGRRGRAVVRREMFPGAEEGRVIVVFAAEVSTGLNPQQYSRSAEYTLQGRGASSERTHVVLEELLDATAQIEPRPYVVLRLHPKNQEEDFARYLGEVDMVSKAEDPLALVFGADLVVGMTSMLMLEAAILGCRTLSILPRRAEAEWLPPLRSGQMPYAATRDSLRRALAWAVAAEAGDEVPDLSAVLTFGASSRIADFVERFRNQGSE